jgi:hypothetical protein
MSKERLNTEDAFMSIMGMDKVEPVKQNKKESVPVKSEQIKPKTAPKKEKKPQPKKLVQTAFYITKQQQKALKMKAALSDRVEDKDQSSIVRAALDVWLADELKQI